MVLRTIELFRAFIFALIFLTVLANSGKANEIFKNIDEAEFVLKQTQQAVIRATAKQKALNTLKSLDLSTLKSKGKIRGETKKSLKSSLIRVFHQYPKARGFESSYAVACIKYGKMYNIDPTVLASVILKESSGNHRLVHSTVRVKVYDKTTSSFRRIKTNAIGLGGIIWEVHKDLLMANGIRSKESLFDPWTNIKGIAVILNYYKGLDRVKGATTDIESALCRYYGIVAGGESARKYLALVTKIRKDIEG